MKTNKSFIKRLKLTKNGKITLLTELPKEKVMYFMSIDGAKFRNPVRPGDKLEYKIEIIKQRKSLIVLGGKAYVGDTLVAEAELKAMIVDK